MDMCKLDFVLLLSSDHCVAVGAQLERGWIA
jgi:hypothetical protein